MNEVFIFWPIIIDGTLTTIKLTLASGVVALIISFTVGLARLSRHWVVRVIATIYLGTSAIVQMFFMYFVLPLLGVFLPALMAGIVACGFNLGAYGSEVVRASVQSVGREQREAAKALNYTNFQLYRYVLIPQAIPVMIPSFGNLVIELLKLTAVASLITISDLTFMSQIIRVQTALTLEPLILIMVIYFILSSILVSGTKWLERYFSAGRNIHKSGGN